jgi:hypothetical protein
METGLPLSSRKARRYWLPKLDRSRTTRLPPNPVVRARELQKALGKHGTAAEVARGPGAHQGGVSQYLTLQRRLPPDLLARLEPEPVRLREMSLRNLMAIAKLEGVGDRRRLRALVKRAGR